MTTGIGPLNRTTADFIGVDPVVSQQANTPIVFLIVSTVLILAAFQGRKWQQV